MREAIHVLVVDHSAVSRQMLSDLLSQEPGITVSVAVHPLFALERMRRVRPDVIVLDLELPEMDGLSFLQRVMATDPIPVVACSELAARGTEAAFRAIEGGAVAVIEKPRLGVKGFREDAAVMLRDAVVEAASARVKPGRGREALPREQPEVPSRPEKRVLGFASDRVVALGASTGGTEALRTILEAMPPDAPGLLIVQHMPEAFTRAFAQRLDRSCRIEVKEAQAGDLVLRGRALVAPGNRHLSLERRGRHYVARIEEGPLVSRHRPSVDVLFRSVAAAAGRHAVGAVLTGMGSDGASGLRALREAGAATLAQDEASSVVFGMPREAIERGAVEEIVGLGDMASAILRRARGLSPVRRA